MFGGVAGGQRLGDTWEFDGADWIARAAAVTPGPRAHAAMAFDTARGRVALFGGERDSGGNAALDSWEWDGTQWSTTALADPPQARSASAAAFDSAHGAVVLFGGQLTASGAAVAAPLGDTWIWDGVTWAPRAVATQVPTERRQPAVVYDPSRGTIRMFGGAPFDVPTRDAWEWDGVSWSQDAVASLPTPRSGTAIATDGTRMVMFGGFMGGALGDTWAWDGTRWIQQTLSVAPSPRYLHAMAYDATRTRFVLFGGISATGATLADTWEWDGAQWIQASPVHVPPARQAPAFAYNPGTGRVVMFGGLSIADSVGGIGFLDDMWEWDGTDWIKDTPATTQTWEWNGADWQRQTSAQLPMLLGTTSLVYDARRGHVVLVDGGDALNDDDRLSVWDWDGTSWHDRAITQTLPPSLTGFAMAYDAAHANAILFGGEDTVAEVFGPVFNDTWTWSGAVWQQQAPATSPPARFGHAMAYDSARNRIVLFGGTNSIPSTLRGDTWEWDGVSWQAVASTGPHGRFGHALVYDAARGQTLLLGGSLSEEIALFDQWAWDGTRWTEITPATMPPKRTNFAMAYDPVRQRVVLFGGVTATNQLLNDVWEWDGTTWLDRTPTTPGPQPRRNHALVYDAMNSRVVVFGGGGDFQLLNDLWAWDGLNWTQLATPLAPSPRAGAALICDPMRGVLVLFGGFGNGGVELQDTWTFRQANEDELDRDTSTAAGGATSSRSGAVGDLEPAVPPIARFFTDRGRVAK